MMITLRLLPKRCLHITGRRAAPEQAAVRRWSTLPSPAYPPGPLIHEYQASSTKQTMVTHTRTATVNPVGGTHTRRPEHTKAKAQLLSTWKSVVDLVGESEIVL
ncbi:hypothetical protein NMY22_g13193 [Coprinellus aureogranulatus]|nr:hypothetical protein NMY22_g13193 [Coprinellus aureogranulatus]